MTADFRAIAQAAERGVVDERLHSAMTLNAHARLGASAATSEPDNASDPRTPLDAQYPKEGSKGAISLRPADSHSRHDIEGIVSLGREVFYETFAHTVPSAEAMAEYLDGTYTFDKIRDELSNPSRYCILAERDPVSSSDLGASTDCAEDETHSVAGTDRPRSEKEIVGFAFLATDTTEECIRDLPLSIELQRIYTHPTTHGTGLATRLANAAFQYGIANGYKHIWLGVLPENTRAVAFYKKIGFEKVGTHEFRVGDHVDIDDIMARNLGEPQG